MKKKEQLKWLDTSAEALENYRYFLDTVQAMVNETMERGWTEEQARELVLSVLMGKKQ